MDINVINKEDRPRERLIRKGGEALSDVELLAIMLGSGSKELGVLDLANKLLNDYGLDKLLNMSYAELSKIKGIKEGKACRLMACFELAKRASLIKKENVNFKCGKDIFKYVYPEFKYLKKECFMVLYLDTKLRLIASYKKMDGIAFEVEIPVRKIITDAVSLDTYGIILIHNHPTGDPKPSQADIDSTNNISELLNVVKIVLLDHIIIGDNNYYSMLENGVIF